MTENKEDNRIWFMFDEKPSRAVCEIMRKYGFKWSPSREAWVRMLNESSRYNVERAIKDITALETQFAG